MADNKPEYVIPHEALDDLGRLAMEALHVTRDSTHQAVSLMKIPHLDVGAIVIPFIVMEDAIRVYTFLGSSTDLLQALMIMKLEVKRLEEHMAKLSANADG